MTHSPVNCGEYRGLSHDLHSESLEMASSSRAGWGALTNEPDGKTCHLSPAIETQFDSAFFIFGLRRGGNHAICEWLKGTFPADSAMHINSAEMAEISIERGAISIDRDKYSSVQPTKEQRNCLIGYENLDFSDFPFDHNSAIAKNSHMIVILRDYPNMAASIAASAHERPSFAYRNRVSGFPELWQKYASHFESGAPHVTFVSYNEWFSNKNYRIDLAARLGLDFSDRGLNSVSAFGQGSSFDQQSFDGRAQSMDVLGRWKSMLDDRLSQFLLLAEPENLGANARLFGNFPFSYEDILARWQAPSPNTTT